MERQILCLTRPVTVTGWPIFGHYRSEVTIEPPAVGRPFSWTLERKGRLISISPYTVKATGGLCNLSVRDGWRTWDHSLEHLLILKPLGLLGATIRSTHCLPYFGNGEH